MEIKSERVTAAEYIEFLSRTDLGSQYPKERFRARIERLVRSVPISVTARDGGKLVGVCFGITDFAYWLFLTDLGVDRDYVRQGIGTKMLRLAHELAGGERDIIIFVDAHRDAIPFYKKFGMRDAAEILEYDRVDWTQFTVGKDEF